MLLRNGTAYWTTASTNITAVYLTGDFVGSLRSKERQEVLQTLGTLPNLRELHLEEGLLMIADVATMLLKAKSIITFSMRHMVLQGHPEDFDACEVALKHHGTLKDFRIMDCTPALEEISLDKLEIAAKNTTCAAPMDGLKPKATNAKTA